METVNTMLTWVKTKEFLPQVGIGVLVCFDDGAQLVCEVAYDTTGKLVWQTPGWVGSQLATPRSMVCKWPLDHFKAWAHLPDSSKLRDW